jgi:hypothetical protein
MGPYGHSVAGDQMRLIAFALLIAFTCTTAAQAQVSPNAATEPNRQAPVGHRQPTPQSVGKAEAERGTPSQPQSRGRDLGSELSICRGC